MDQLEEEKDDVKETSLLEQSVEKEENLEANKEDENSAMEMLGHSEHEVLNWSGEFQYSNMCRTGVPKDGSCFFHAIAKAYFKPYILGKLNGRPFNKTLFIQTLRRNLAKLLGSKIPNSNKTYWETLSRGEFVRISKHSPEFSLTNMANELASPNTPISDIYNEFISDQLNIDIYILDAERKDVYMNGADMTLLYKNRPSIVLLYLPGHYELIGIADGNYITTYFSPDDPFIKYIRARMEQLSK